MTESRSENWEDEGKQREVALTPSVHERGVESVGNKLCLQSAFSFNQGNNNAPRQTHGTKRAVNGERAVMYGTYSESRSNTYLNRSHSFISNLHPVSTNTYTEVIDSMKESGGSETLPGGTPQEFPSKQPIRPEGGWDLEDSPWAVFARRNDQGPDNDAGESRCQERINSGRRNKQQSVWSLSRVQLPDWVADGDQTSVVLWLSVDQRVLRSRMFHWRLWRDMKLGFRNLLPATPEYGLMGSISGARRAVGGWTGSRQRVWATAKYRVGLEVKEVRTFEVEMRGEKCAVPSVQQDPMKGMDISRCAEAPDCGRRKGGTEWWEISSGLWVYMTRLPSAKCKKISLALVGEFQKRAAQPVEKGRVLARRCAASLTHSSAKARDYRSTIPESRIYSESYNHFSRLGSFKRRRRQHIGEGISKSVEEKKRTPPHEREPEDKTPPPPAAPEKQYTGKPTFVLPEYPVVVILPP
ncbi:hypothetical protein FB45DRAFT_876406 [Roridomyces roridus]|uniref:Uncharacterized protein n=1 Tax=Roridomyces roridus TaxID=1738132 RepID=A0AAD7B3F7_9AGAR|nr:hypothetical protein FB45DRAFT_876406 [Roridomyces roridus]